MADSILTINAGSSSLKFALFQSRGLATMGNGQVEGIGAASRLICKDAAGNAIHADARPIGDHAQAMAACWRSWASGSASKGHRDRPPGGPWRDLCRCSRQVYL